MYKLKTDVVDSEVINDDNKNQHREVFHRLHSVFLHLIM